MAYTAPTVDDFAAQFPEFDEQVEESQITAALTLAMRSVDETWIEGDYSLAILYLAAHVVSVGLFAADNVGSELIKSLSIGPLSITYGNQISASDLETSIYGQQFLKFRRRSKPAVLVV